jgi:hypothetical protein
MKLNTTSCYVHIDMNRMAAILKDEESEKYYYQVVPLNCMGIEQKEIKKNKCIGPYDDFKIVNDEIDKMKANERKKVV